MRGPFWLETSEAVTQGIGFRPQRISQVSGEHRTMQNVKAYFNEKLGDLYARYRLAKTDEDRRAVIRDMQRFNMEAGKYRGINPSITTTSLKQATFQKPEKPFLAFGRMMEAGP